MPLGGYPQESDKKKKKKTVQTSHFWLKCTVQEVIRMKVQPSLFPWEISFNVSYKDWKHLRKKKKTYAENRAQPLNIIIWSLKSLLLKIQVNISSKSYVNRSIMRTLG